MIRGFLSGVFWGGVVGLIGLGAASQLTPMPVARIEAEASQVPKPIPDEVDPEAVAEPEAQPEAEAPVVEQAPVEPAAEPEAAAPVAEPEAAAPVAEPEAAAPVAEPEPAAPAAEPEAAAPAVEPETAAEVEPADKAVAELDPPAGSEFAKPLPDVEPVLPTADAAPSLDAGAVAPLTPPATDAASAQDQPATAPETGLEAPKPMDLPEESAVAADVPATADPAQIALAEPEQPTLPQTDVAPAPAEEPAPPAKAAPEEALLKPLPEVLPVPDTPAEEPEQLEPDPALVPEGDAIIDPAGEDATLAPTPGLDSEVDGVITGRLPRIGDAQPLPEGEALPAAEANPDANSDVVIDGEDDVPPLRKYAREFENPDAKPLFSIILIDTGGADLDRAALAALPFPVSFVLDPLAPDVAKAAKIYRDAGQEVVMVATGIPAGATASDLEVTFQSHAAALPEAVAVIDTEFGAFQADRPLATQVVPILKAQGRGLISWDRGLNAADQVARREGLAAGMVFRKLDGTGENKAAVRRALDRAAFKAAQDGRVMVIGQTLPETVAALVEWAVEGRSAAVALAPVSAVLATQ